MSEEFIKLGPKIVTKDLERIFNNTIAEYSFKGFFNLQQTQRRFLGLFLCTRGFPTLFIYVSETGPFIIGLCSTKDTSKKAIAQKKISIPQEFLEEYRELFRSLHVPQPNESSLKMFLGTFSKPLPVPSFSVVGKKSETVELLNREGVYGRNLFSAAGLFSEEKFIKILMAYEMWKEEGYRFDFQDEQVLFSLRMPENSKSTENEDRAIAAMINHIVSKTYPNIFLASEGETLLGVPNILTTFFIKFERFSKFLSNLKPFINRFHKSCGEIDSILEEILVPKMNFLK
ncbi:MAG: hypothetical protein U9N62_02950 [Thermotogota bacterium]|nr:hypothetical protein [Thermotogota bacterium]